MNFYTKIGGMPSIFLIIISVLSFMVILYKFYILYFKKEVDIIGYLENNIKKKNDYNYLLNKLDEKITREESFYYENIWILKFSYTVAPLLGILGTVLGLIKSFANLTNKENTDIISSSISQALVTTALGLVVAMIILFFYSIILEKINKKIENIEIEGKSYINDFD